MSRVPYLRCPPVIRAGPVDTAAGGIPAAFGTLAVEFQRVRARVRIRELNSLRAKAWPRGSIAIAAVKKGWGEAFQCCRKKWLVARFLRLQGQRIGGRFSGRSIPSRLTSARHSPATPKLHHFMPSSCMLGQLDARVSAMSLALYGFTRRAYSFPLCFSCHREARHLPNTFR